VTLSAKLAFVLLVPLAAWVITSIYQHAEHVRASTEASILRTAEQTAEILEMNKDLQLASDMLLTNCSKDGQSASNLCLAEYVSRIIRLNGLTSQLSWKSGALPLPQQAVAAQRQWQNMWWDDKGEHGAVALKTALVAMAKTNRLLKCQELDFADSECGGEIKRIFDAFRGETTKVMCAMSLSLRTRTLSLYASLPSGDESRALVDNMRDRLKDSYCAKLFDKKPLSP
jgi:hypothetical protein